MYNESIIFTMQQLGIPEQYRHQSSGKHLVLFGSSFLTAKTNGKNSYSYIKAYPWQEDGGTCLGKFPSCHGGKMWIFQTL